MANTIDKNQYDYLNGLVSKGGGNGEWAKAQLANSTYTPPAPTNSPSVPKSAAIPTPPSFNQASAAVGTIPKANIPAPPASPSAPAATTTVNPGVQQYADFQAQQADLMKQLHSYMQAPNSYDASSDPNYQAYKRLTESQAKQASLGTMEELNSRGILNSSVTRDDVAGIEQQYAQQAAAMIPQFQQQAYQQSRDRVADTLNLLQNVQGQQQRSIENTNADRNFGINQGQLTGYYTPDASTIEAVQKKMAANSAAYASASPDEQRRLHEENVKLAATIGGTDSTGSGDYVYSPIRTVQGQQMDYNKQVDQRNFDYQTQIDAVKNGQWDKQFDLEMQKWADEKNLNWANMDLNTKKALAQIALDQQQVAISQQNANTSSSNAAWARDPNNPDNMYKMTQINKANSDGSAVKIDSKDSADNYDTIIGDLGMDGVTKEQAKQLAQANRSYLTDSDYKKLLDEINKRF